MEDIAKQDIASILETFDKYESLVDYLHKLSFNNNLVFRGFSLADQMLPNLLRKNLEEHEIELLDRFERYGRSYYSVSNPIDFLSQGQHFGLPTRLIDFTHNPFIALYFALHTRKAPNIKDDSDRKYYYIRYCDVTEQIYFRQLPSIPLMYAASSNSITSECMIAINSLNRVLTSAKNIQKEIKKDGPDDFRKTEAAAFILTGLWDNPGKQISVREKQKVSNTLEKFRQSRLLFIEPNQANQRIIMQQGLFLFPYELQQENLQNQIIKNTKVIKIQNKLRPQLLQYLDNIGITAYRLMPDLGNICNEIARSIKKDER